MRWYELGHLRSSSLRRRTAVVDEVRPIGVVIEPVDELVNRRVLQLVGESRATILLFCESISRIARITSDLDGSVPVGCLLYTSDAADE